MQRGVLPSSSYPVLFVIGKEQKEGMFRCEDLNMNLAYGFGYQELQVAKQTFRLGGHIRIGFENNELLENKKVATDNAELIAQVATV